MLATGNTRWKRKKRCLFILSSFDPQKKAHSKPSLEKQNLFSFYRQHPAVVTAPFIAPGRFVGESCAAAADFGIVRRNILHVFDKGASPDMDQLAAQVSGAVVGISGAPVVGAAPAVELPSYGVPMPAPLAAGSSASSAAAVGASENNGVGLGGKGGLGGGIGGGAGGIGGGAAPDAAAGASSSGSSRK